MYRGDQNIKTLYPCPNCGGRAHDIEGSPCPECDGSGVCIPEAGTVLFLGLAVVMLLAVAGLLLALRF
jgi:hypothetical protein